MKFAIVLCVFLAIVSSCAAIQSVADDDLVAVPGRGWVSRNCVHQVPEDSIITRLGNGDFRVQHPAGDYVVEALLEECSAPRTAPKAVNTAAPYQGWNAYVSDIQAASNSYTKFYGSWNVPAAPTNPDSSSVIFFFTGLQDQATVSDPTIDIIQPVLQFGDKSAAGGCLCWAIASWYVPSSGRSFVSPLKKVSAGSNIFGNMTKTGSDCWYISATDGSVITPLSLCQTPLISQPQAYVTEEAYTLSCADYPPSSTALTFTNLALYGPTGAQVSPTWRTNYNTPNCNSVVTVGSPSEVKFTW